ncbi:helix-turn-helix domain-containing protein [Sphingobacterium sp. JB170]|uniref:winged helix-turn-helix transcriptional regulator n=1 Tax=Sphingobacterium sp. JB170 TaxID=1434842 RepID=UPI00097F55C5|nr:helix-turn-helix domain-containing protein [Sphingobacterium sp. JB170]SJN48009.1 Transcriptional regulator, HxlR family [Sphingobacterium sp. JB170]
MENIKTPLEECGHTILANHDVMDLLNGKWKVSIIACLCFRTMRYSELLKEVRGVSGKMLSRDLRELEDNHLIKRTIQATQPVTVEHAITEYGYTLKKLTSTIAEWGWSTEKKIING